MVHHPVADHEDMADKALSLDVSGDKHNIYYAMASFKEVQYITTKKGREVPAGRKQDNALLVKSLWQDFDVKDQEGAYATLDEAKEALKQYVKATGLPPPLVVGSGYGLHAYWVFDEAISADQWTTISRLQRAVAKSLGIKFDPSRDRDCASVLRAPGCHNYKNPDDPRTVRVISKYEHKTMPAMFYKQLFQSYVMEHDTPVEAERMPRSNLSAGDPEYPPSYMEVAAEHCAQLRFFRDGGTASEPVWYAMLGVAKHCEDGQEFAHKFSEADERYDEEVCQAKFEQWATGPTTCSKFKELCSDRCQGCAHTVKSPIQLGHVVPAQSEITVMQEGDPLPEVPSAPVEVNYFPPEVSFRNGRMCWAVADENGVVQHVPFAYPKFYILDRVSLEDGTAALHVRMERPMDGIKDFDIPFKALADAKRGCKPALMSYGVTVMNGDLATNYILNRNEELARTKRETNTFRQFGWTEDRTGFVIGNKLLSREGERTIRLDSKVSNELHNLYTVKGTKEEWISGVDKLYNRRDMEPWQYIIATAFGAIISPFMLDENWKGIPVAMTSDDSGFGKTTVCKIAINAFYNSSAATMNDITPKAILARASNLSNLPALFDEVTKSLKDSEHLSEVLYGLSNGRGRIRLRNDGTESASHPQWNLMSYLTGNKNVLFQLTENRANPEAEQLRVFEIDMTGRKRLEAIYKDEQAEMLEISNALLNHTKGVLAEEFIRFIMANQGAVHKKLTETFMSIAFKLGGNATKERFYAYHIACTIVGGAIAKKLGYIKFDMTHLRDWALKHIESLRGQVEEYGNTPQDRFHMMLMDMYPGLLITRHYEKLNARNERTELPQVPLRAPLTGRYCMGGADERPKLYIASSAVDKWCIENRVSPASFKRELIQHRIIRTPDGAVSSYKYLARGVPTFPASKCRVIEFDANLAAGMLEEPMKDASVTPLTGTA